MEFTIFLMLVTLLNISITIHLFIDLKALKNSTHQVTYLNPDKQEFEKMTEETLKELTKDPFDNVI